MNREFHVESSPHIRGRHTIDSIMWDVVIALTPVMAASIYFFGMAAVRLLVVTTVWCLVFEAVALPQNRKSIRSFLGDGSAATTGVLLGLSLPPVLGTAAEHLWMPVVGSAVAILLGKHLFGGLGKNPFNPALVGRAFLLLLDMDLMAASWIIPGVDGITSATPLRVQAEGYTLLQMFLGDTPGSLGETSALAILIGGGYLLAKKHIDWRIPGGFLGAMAVVAALRTASFYGLNAAFPWNAAYEILFQLFSGTAFLAAFFFATCYVTSPTTPRGRLLYGIGCGLLIILIRYFGRLPEGAFFAILLMNAFTPLIDRLTVPRTFGACPKSLFGGGRG